MILFAVFLELATAQTSLPVQDQLPVDLAIAADKKTAVAATAVTVRIKDYFWPEPCPLQLQVAPGQWMDMARLPGLSGK